MSERTLGPREVERLRRAELTYAEVGGTLTGVTPPGYHPLHRSTHLGTGEERLHDVADALLGWEVHRRAGVEVRASGARAAEGVVAVLRLGLGPLGVRAPVRVVRAIEEPRRRGFAYGTLPGHPESGEEAFVVELGDDGAVVLTITAFSRPATPLARLGGPVTSRVQSLVTRRYLRALSRPPQA